MIRVLVAARSASIRPALNNAIRSSASLELAGALDADRLSAEGLAADVLLIDAAEPNDFDWQALADVPIPALALLDSADSSLVASVLRAGIRGAIASDATPEEIESAVHAVAAGLIVTAPASLDALLHPAAIAEELAEPLSARELEVLDLIAEGLSNKLIAHRLNISEHTVKTHVASIFAKLNASSRTEAVSQAIRRGLVML